MSSENLSLNRRRLLATVGTAVGASTLGTTSVTAAGSCTDSDYYSQNDNWQWAKDYLGSYYEYCDGHTTTTHRKRMEHGASLAYYGSVYNETLGKWHHDFVATGHAETWEQPKGYDCGSEWDRTSDVRKFKARFENNLTDTTNIPTETGSDVKAFPRSDDRSDQNMDLFVAVLAEVLGAAHWPLGAALSIAAAVKDGADDASGDQGAFYKWTPDFSRCGTHCVHQTIDSKSGADRYTDDNVKFRYESIFWCDDIGSDPWHKIYWDIDFDADDTSSTNTGQSAGTSDQSLSVGDYVTTSEGERVQVEKVDRSPVQRLAGSEPTTVPVEEVPAPLKRRLRQASDVPHGNVALRRFPFTVQRTEIAGTVV